MEYIFYFIIAILILAPIYLIVTMYRIRQAQRRLEWLSSQKYTTLRIDVPKNNDKMPLAAEQMFASIHGIYSESAQFQNHLSFEIVAKDKFIQFYVHVPHHIKDFVEGQIYAQYPTVEINEVADYTQALKSHNINFAVSELLLNKPDVYPIRFFDSFEVDPLSGITSVMSKLNPGEEVWFQLLLRPVGDDWQERGNGIVSAVRSGKKPGGQGFLEAILVGLKNFFKLFISQAINPGAEIAAPEKGEVKLPATVEEALKGIEQKITKLGFETKIRILCIAKDPVTAGVRCQTVAAAFKQFNTNNLNGFKVGEIVKNNFEQWQAYTNREFIEKGNILNIAELASVYHLPNQTVETPNIVWSGSKKGEPPANLPLVENISAEELTVIGMTNFRNVYRQFGIKIDDRKRHVYIIGKSGVGKSVLMENMAIDDVAEGRGVIIVDPHGEFADKILACIPDNRVDDVIVFDPADRAYPIAFNLLESVDDDFKGMVASGFVGIFKKIFGDSWGPRLEHILRNTVLALLDFTNSTMLDIPKMLTDSRFRDKVVEKVKDPIIKDFWVNEFAQYDAKFRTEAVSPILNKVGQFLATATIRNIVGQPNSKINIREIMDQKKILIVNLSRGKIGEDNSALLGAMMITKIQLSAMSRADVTVDKRPECFLYVDEFQNFATDSFAVILAEARKYNLALTMANQYIEQLPEEVRSAVFGNAGTIISFRVGGTDADFLVKEFEPVFDVNDLVNLDKYHIYIKLLIDGTSAPAFSAKTLPPVEKLTGNAGKIINLSHEKYSSNRAYVEEQIAARTKEEEDELKAEAEAFRQGGLEALLLKKPHHPSITFEPPKPVMKPSIDQTAEATHETIERPKTTIQENLEPPRTENISQSSEEKIGEGEDLNSQNNLLKKQVEEKPAKKDKPRVFKYQNIIGDKIFKEQTARGGVKWYIGEDIDFDHYTELGVDINDNAKKMITLAKAVYKNDPSKTTGKREDANKKEKLELKSTGNISSLKISPQNDVSSPTQQNLTTNLDQNSNVFEAQEKKTLETPHQIALESQKEVSSQQNIQPKEEGLNLLIENKSHQLTDKDQKFGSNQLYSSTGSGSVIRSGHLQEGEEIKLDQE